MVMIKTAQEFLRLVDSEDKADRWRARIDEAAEELWSEVLMIAPDYVGSVALNKRLPDAILRVLATDPNDRIRGIVAMKRRLPSDVFQMLADDASELVRITIAKNPRTPTSALRKLALRHDCSGVEARMRLKG